MKHFQSLCFFNNNTNKRAFLIYYVIQHLPFHLIWSSVLSHEPVWYYLSISHWKQTEWGVGISQIRLHIKTTWLYASVLFPLWLCIHLSTYLSIRWWVRGAYKEWCCLFGGVGLTLKFSEERSLWWNGPGRTVTSPLRLEGHAGLAWFACEWELSIILVRELSHRIEKVKTSFYQPFPSETEQAINNWIQAQGKVKQNDMGLL